MIILRIGMLWTRIRNRTEENFSRKKTRFFHTSTTDFRDPWEACSPPKRHNCSMIYTAPCIIFGSVHIHYEGEWEGVGHWNLRVIWALCGECHLGPKKLVPTCNRNFPPFRSRGQRGNEQLALPLASTAGHLPHVVNFRCLERGGHAHFRFFRARIFEHVRRQWPV